MRGNEQKYVPDMRARSPGGSQFSNLAGDFQTSAPTFTPGERMTFSSPDYGRLNSGTGIPYQASSSINQNYYEKDFKIPQPYTTSIPQQFPLPEYRSTFDTNTMFVPQSKYLQEEMKKSSYTKDFNYAPPAPKPMAMPSSYGGMSVPQPQKIWTKTWNSKVIIQIMKFR